MLRPPCPSRHCRLSCTRTDHERIPDHRSLVRRLERTQPVGAARAAAGRGRGGQGAVFPAPALRDRRRRGSAARSGACRPETQEHQSRAERRRARRCARRQRHAVGRAGAGRALSAAGRHACRRPVPRIPRQAARRADEPATDAGRDASDVVAQGRQPAARRRIPVAAELRRADPARVHERESGRAAARVACRRAVRGRREAFPAEDPSAIAGLGVAAEPVARDEVAAQRVRPPDAEPARRDEGRSRLPEDMSAADDAVSAGQRVDMFLRSDFARCDVRPVHARADLFPAGRRDGAPRMRAARDSRAPDRQDAGLSARQFRRNMGAAAC
ncbi:hypothetical protein BLAT2472_10009 [Burkholderia latens]